MPIRTERSARPEPTPASRLGSAQPRRPEHPGSPFPRPAPRRPDPSAARLALAAGGIATLSALVAAIAGGAVPASTVASTPAGTVASPSNGATVPYAYIQSGQAAPAVVATQLAPSAPVQATVVTRQSGARP
jgi:hypothetical protein